MKRKLLFIPLLVILILSSMAMPVLADGPTGVIVTWDGAGVVDGSVDTGDTLTYFHSEGTDHVGAFNATDSNNNPYSYNVDNNVASLETVITGTGWAEIEVNRTDSYVPMYGAAGQQSYTYVGVSEGIATLQNRSSTNYAQMVDGNYGWKPNDHITVTGATSYALTRYMDSGAVDFAGIAVTGTGDADLDCMSSEASGVWATKLGRGAGCYTNADFTANGTGTMSLVGTGDTTATTALAPGMIGASSFNFIASWSGSFSIADYSVTVH